MIQATRSRLSRARHELATILMFKKEAVRGDARLDVTVSYMTKYVAEESTDLSLREQKTEGLTTRKSENIKTFCLWMPVYQVHLSTITSQLLTTFTC
jgi:hypothetical protein